MDLWRELFDQICSLNRSKRFHRFNKRDPFITCSIPANSSGLVLVFRELLMYMTIIRIVCHFLPDYFRFFLFFPPLPSFVYWNRLFPPPGQFHFESKINFFPFFFSLQVREMQVRGARDRQNRIDKTIRAIIVIEMRSASNLNDNFSGTKMRPKL